MAVAGATGDAFTYLINPSDPSENGAQLNCTVTIGPPFGITWPSTPPPVTSATVTATVLPRAVYYTNGTKLEYFANIDSRPDVENGNVGPAAYITTMPVFDNPGGLGNNYVTRNSGWFIAPTTDSYVFFVATDDDSDLFLSLDTNPAHKQLIAQETAWVPMDAWLGDTNFVADGEGIPSQQRSDQWTNSAGVAPWASGFTLTKNNLYYIELVHHQGDGGDSFGVTYQTATMMSGVTWTNTFTNGVPSLINGTNSKTVLVTFPATYVKFTTEPTNVLVSEDGNATFYAVAGTDGEFAPQYQ